MRSYRPGPPAKMMSSQPRASPLRSLLDSSNEGVIVHRAPDIGLILVVQLDPVRVALVPNTNDLGPGPRSHIGLHDVTDLEPKLSFDFALHDARLQCFVVQVPPDENKTTLARLFLA